MPLHRVAARERAQQRRVGGEPVERCVIRLEIALVRGKEKASLTRLRVRDVLENRLRRFDRSVGVDNVGAGGARARQAAIRQQTEEQHDGGDPARGAESLSRGESHARRTPAPGLRARSAGRWVPRACPSLHPSQIG